MSAFIEKNPREGVELRTAQHGDVGQPYRPLPPPERFLLCCIGFVAGMLAFALWVVAMIGPVG